MNLIGLLDSVFRLGNKFGVTANRMTLSSIFDRGRDGHGRRGFQRIFEENELCVMSVLKGGPGGGGGGRFAQRVALGAGRKGPLRLLDRQ